MVEFWNAWACRCSTTATTSGRWRWRRGWHEAFAFPGFVPAYIRPLFCRGVGPFRWCALSGDPEDIWRTDAKVRELMPGRRASAPLARHGARADRVPGAAGADLLGGAGDRHRLGLAFNAMVASGELKAPVVIGRDHLDSGSVASPNRETEAMRGRLGRGQRLAAAERAAELRERGDLGAACTTAAAWAWGSRQHAGMVVVARRHARGGAAARAGAVERPGDRRDAPRRRRL